MNKEKSFPKKEEKGKATTPTLDEIMDSIKQSMTQADELIEILKKYTK